MGKDDKEKLVLSTEEAAALLRQLADRISGVEAEFESDLLPSDGSFEKLKLSLKRAKNSTGFVIKCKVKPAHEKKSDKEEEAQEEDRPQSAQQASDSAPWSTDQPGEEL